MKFRFCGDQDAPDWILAEVSVLSKMSSVRMKLICRQIINQLLGTGMNYDKLWQLTHSSRIALEVDELKALVAALHFIFSSAAKHDVDPTTVLMSELQQLGLPRDVCLAIVKALQQSKDKIREQLKKNVLRFPRVTNVDWRVDYILSSSALPAADTVNIRMQLGVSQPSLRSSGVESGAEHVERGNKPQQNGHTAKDQLHAALSSAIAGPSSISFALTPNDFRLLYNDLKQARQILQNV